MPWLGQVPGVLLDVVPGPGGGQRARRRDPRRSPSRAAACRPRGPRPRPGCPSVTPVDGVLPYDEGLSIGYRGEVEPLLPFGHGLGYTSWEYLAMDGARVRLANTGTRPGREVVQVYASRPDSAIDRPPRWLAGFAVVEAAAGEEVIVDVPLNPRAFEHWGAPAGRPSRASSPSRRAAPSPICALRVHMELRQLEYFAAVARHRHFTRAAESLYITQPALSQQIRRLEAELGLTLLRRTSKGVELTAAGEDLLVHAEKVLAEVAAARADMDRHTGVARGVVRVAATAADAPRLPEALVDFHADHPGIQIALRQGSAAEVVALVQSGTVDVAVLALPGEPPAGVEATSLTEEPLRLAVNLDDELAGTTVDIDGAARPPVHPLGAGHRAARDGRRRHAGGGLQPAAAVRGRRSDDRALPGPGEPRARDRPRFLARTARAGGRRGGSAPRAVPPAVTAHACGGSVTGRPAAPRAPARALTPGGASGARRPASGRGRRC